jgi:hypothetical protein
MAKFTKSIRFGLKPGLLSLIRTAAQKQNVSVSELVRTAVARHLGDLGEQFSSQAPPHETESDKQSSFSLPSLDMPLVNGTREEEEAAHRAMQLFLNHDE